MEILRQKLLEVSKLLRLFGRYEERYKRITLPLKTVKDFQSVPITTRQDLVRLRQGGMNINVFNVTATSGSTSSRLLVTHSRKCHEAHLRRLGKMYASIGINKRDLCLNLCSYGLNSGGRLMEVGYKAAGAGVIPFGAMGSSATVEEALQLIRTLKPTVINSYTNQIFDIFARLGRMHSVRLCVVNGEPLTPSFKAKIEELGSVKIYDHYGAMEISGIAIAEEPCDKFMRVFDDGLLLEVATGSRKARSEGRGALLVTDCYNRSMPIIRYQIGDEVELKRGRTGLYMRVLGRLSDSLLIDGQVCEASVIVRSVQGLLLHPNFFVVVQKDANTYQDKVIVHVPPEDLTRSANIRKAFPDFLDLGGRLSVTSFTGAIPRTTSGKVRHILDARKETS